MTASEVPEQQEQPALRIITPSTTPEEIAAIVAVFAALGGGESKAPRPTRTWASVARRVGATSVPRPGNWRTSVLPH